MCQGPVLEVLLSTSPIELNENLIQQISFMVSRLVLNEIEKKKKKTIKYHYVTFNGKWNVSLDSQTLKQIRT